MDVIRLWRESVIVSFHFDFCGSRLMSAWASMAWNLLHLFVSRGFFGFCFNAAVRPAAQTHVAVDAVSARMAAVLVMRAVANPVLLIVVIRAARIVVMAVAKKTPVIVAFVRGAFVSAGDASAVVTILNSSLNIHPPTKACYHE